LKHLFSSASLRRGNRWQRHAENVEQPKRSPSITAPRIRWPGASATACASAPVAAAIGCSISTSIRTPRSCGTRPPNSRPTLHRFPRNLPAPAAANARAAAVRITTGQDAAGMNACSAGRRWRAAGGARNAFRFPPPEDGWRMLHPVSPGNPRPSLMVFFCGKNQVVAKAPQNVVHHRPWQRDP